MQTQLADFIKNTAEGREADAILRSCVHCGLCTATCPTYLLLGDERDGPRGRIYLIKQMLEGQSASSKTQLHLDRCLTCRACETICPSGVRYGRLLEIGRGVLDEKVRRTWLDWLQRKALRIILPYPKRFAPLLHVAGWLRPVLPKNLAKKIPKPESKTKSVSNPTTFPGRSASWPGTRHTRKMLVLEGCVQLVMAPSINAAAARILDRLGISLVLVPKAGCCGALSYHLSAREEGLGFMRRNIDAWMPYLDQGVEAIVMTASGCGLMVKEYADALKHDAAYAEKAARVSALALDLAEVLAWEDLSLLPMGKGRRIAFQSPCTLQHGQKLNGLVEGILARLGFDLALVANPHLCCGSAGTYSILQPDLSLRLLSDKLESLHAGKPECIATANIGCLTHIQSGTGLPVVHWVELVDGQ